MENLFEKTPPVENWQNEAFVMLAKENRKSIHKSFGFMRIDKETLQWILYLLGWNLTTYNFKI